MNLKKNKLKAKLSQKTLLSKLFQASVKIFILAHNKSLRVRWFLFFFHCDCLLRSPQLRV